VFSLPADTPVGSLTTAQVKQMVSLTHGLRPEEARLMFAGRQLAEGQPLARYGIRSGDKLQLAPLAVRWPSRNPVGTPVLVTVRWVGTLRCGACVCGRRRWVLMRDVSPRRLPSGAVVNVSVPLNKAKTMAYLSSSIHFATLSAKVQTLRYVEPCHDPCGLHRVC
jgi:hypothetical protein